MTLTFAQLRKQDLLRVALSTDRYAEQVDFYPAGGPPRQIIVSVVHGDMATLSESSHDVQTVERIRVRAAKDQSAADNGNAIGGIADPRLGDCLVRGDDPKDRAYSFVNKLGETTDSWFLLFQRQRREQVGTSNTRQRLA